MSVSWQIFQLTEEDASITNRVNNNRDKHVSGNRDENTLHSVSKTNSAKYKKGTFQF